MKLTWQCELCKDVQTSCTTERHKMDFCKCGESGVDLEEHYMRAFGKIKELKND